MLFFLFDEGRRRGERREVDDFRYGDCARAMELGVSTWMSFSKQSRFASGAGVCYGGGVEFLEDKSWIREGLKSRQ